MRLRTINLPWTTVCVDGATEVAIPASGWVRASEVARLRPTWEARGFTGLMNVVIGYQTANVENAPDAHTTVGSFQTTAGNIFGSSFVDVISAMQAKQWVRLVWVAKLTSGSTLATVRVGGKMEILDS